MSIVDAVTTNLPEDILDEYHGLSGIYDELTAPDGSLRPYWKDFLDGLRAMPEGEVQQHWQTALRLIRQHGVTYNVYGDPKGEQRPWELDTVPLIIPEHEWLVLERGLKQRAKLLNMILADLYGPQRLLREGLLPPGLVFANPSFHLACHDIKAPMDTFLQIYAADLARSPDGRWWVFNDRTQAPSGAGYALENRVITAQCLSDLFRESGVRRLSHFFQALRANLRRLSGKDDPRIVLLTPGPLNETYFEHAFLARYLGYALVEGADLTVRDHKVYLKTVGGLRQVDVILRRLDTEWVDPLELRSDSALGVPGLVQAVRSGNVVMANALGSGVVETTGLMGFLPGLSRHLLGEDLILPHVATWWCGQPEARSHVLDKLDNMLVSPCFQHKTLISGETSFKIGSELDPDVRARMESMIRDRGHNWVGQEPVALSTAPSWADGRIVPRPMALRMFATALGDDYVVMPGGLTRISDQPSVRAVSMQRGTGSKDTWIPSSDQSDTFSLMQGGDIDPVLRRGGDDLASRAADNLFWLGRYAERTESAMRILRSLLARLAEDPVQDAAGNIVMQKLLFMLAHPGDVEGLMKRRGKALTAHQIEEQIQGYLFRGDRPSSIPELVGTMNGVASMVRDRLSLDAWQTLDQLYRDSRGGRPRMWLDIGDAMAVLNDMLRTMSAFSGLGMENTTRTNGWRFLDMGRRLERAIHMSGLLRGLLAVGEPERLGFLDRLLELADSSMTYRARYVSAPRLVPVLDLLLMDETNPRSVAFQLNAMADHARALPAQERMLDRSMEERIIMSGMASLQLADMKTLVATDKRGRRPELDTLLSKIPFTMAALSETIGRHYFSHADLGRADESLMPRRSIEP